MKTPASAETPARPSSAFSQAGPSTAVSPADTSYDAVGSNRATRYNTYNGRPLNQNPPLATPMRRYEVACLDARGDVKTSTQIAPALPLFESAVAAFARGTLIATQLGEVAIEDLMPGDWITTLDGEPAQIQWIGSSTFTPEQLERHGHSTHMTRILSDAFGVARPMSYIMAGPAARFLHTPDHLRATAGSAKMLSPVRCFVDGNNVIKITPQTPLRLYHICLSRHAIIFAGGLEVESYHPGTGASYSVSHNLRQVYLSMFDHIQHMSDFGPMVFPHAPETLLDDTDAA